MALFTCSKCNKRLDFTSLCVCMDCKRSFCVDEGTVPKDTYYKLIKGTNDRVIGDFLCYECDKTRGKTENLKPKTNEEIRKEAEREQDEKLAKAQQEQEAKELLKQWENHHKTIELPKSNEINIKVGDYGVYEPCSGYLDRYGVKGVIDTNI